MRSAGTVTSDPRVDLADKEAVYAVLDGEGS